tara:strand:+ start:807 stop:1307 length:501 start_codon:yes stop_codon:yes gene_type:complete
MQLMIKKVLITLSVLGLLFVTTEVEASDPNGEIFCMAKNIYFEAGNQPLAGKVAVAQVVLNRVQHHEYPEDICSVVYQAKWFTNWKGNQMPVKNKCQFSWFCDGKSDIPEDSRTWDLCLSIATRVMYNDWEDITEGATHYHASSVYPYWADSLNKTVQINGHIFYK